MSQDFNKLEVLSSSFIADGRIKDALRVYLYMADGDPSLDAGYLGARIAECYEKLGELDAARYWYGRAVEENPDANLEAARALARLGPISIADLFDASK